MNIKKDIDLCFRLICFYYVSVVVSFTFGGMIWLDYYFNLALEDPEDTEEEESSNLPLDDFLLDDLDLQNQTEFEDEKEIRLKTYIYYGLITYKSIITILIVYYIITK